MSKLHELARLGQAIWLDYIRRSFITSGELQQLIDLGLRGMTSNPTIFEKAINGSSDYLSDLERLTILGNTPLEIYESLAINDIRQAADLLRPVYDSSQGEDGYVSLEVAPDLAHDGAATFSEALRLWSLVERPNLMVKIPATREGLDAITQATAAGVNVNVTLIFSLQRYQQVMAAYVKGLELRLKAGLPVSSIASVASFFVSRLDSKVDQRLEQLMRAEGSRAKKAAGLFGKAAVANARLAYDLFEKFFFGPRFEQLQTRGARMQRPLWASTSTKNPSYSDILYIQELIGAHTVNTLPQNTLDAFFEHGEVRLSLKGHHEEAQRVIDDLEELGISMDQVTQELEDEGVASFAKSFRELIESIAHKSEEVLAKNRSSAIGLGVYQPLVEKALAELTTSNIIQRIWKQDYTVWSDKPAEITNRLDWLFSPEDMINQLGKIEALVYAVQQAGYTQALLLGMGGSSLAPELFSKTFSSKPGSAAGLHLEVLDSTHPEAVAHHTARLDPASSLFIVSTKSGGTEETLSFFRYFYNWTASALGEKNAGDHFIAITDPKSKLVDLAGEYKFRACLLNNPNIGGRYSALSFFGLLPAALAGVDLSKLLDRAHQMARSCSANIPVKENPAAQLGVALGELALKGRDKVTFFLSPEITSFGDWVEQLIAESTGKDGRGILPVVGETLQPAHIYGEDRLFVSITLAGDERYHKELQALKAAGHPVLQHQLKDIYELGGQILLWELATAIAGQRLTIHPFDQPNVEAAKQQARQVVDAYRKSGTLSTPTPAISSEQVAVYGTSQAETAEQALTSFLEDPLPGSYICIQAFLPPEAATSQALQILRDKLQERTRLAVTCGYGPRYLHSTGQYHKGGSKNGYFIQFTSHSSKKVLIPDKAGMPEAAMSFNILVLAQALGDAKALEQAGQRVIRFHVTGDVQQVISKLAKAL